MAAEPARLRLPRQIEALKRYRSQSEPAITVQHERSYQKHRPDAGKPAVWRQNPLRRQVSLAGGKWQEAVPDARRRTGVRRAKGKPERAETQPVHQGCDRRAQTDSGVVGRSAGVVRTIEVIGQCRALCRNELACRIEDATARALDAITGIGPWVGNAG
jgi:hypothetical protein